MTILTALSETLSPSFVNTPYEVYDDATDAIDELKWRYSIHELLSDYYD